MLIVIREEENTSFICQSFFGEEGRKAESLKERREGMGPFFCHSRLKKKGEKEMGAFTLQRRKKKKGKRHARKKKRDGST